jgi:hypothetical protein
MKKTMSCGYRLSTVKWCGKPAALFSRKTLKVVCAEHAKGDRTVTTIPRVDIREFV